MKKTLSSILLGTSLLLGANEARAFPTIPINAEQIKEENRRVSYDLEGFALLGVMFLGTLGFLYEERDKSSKYTPNYEI